MNWRMILSALMMVLGLGLSARATIIGVPGQYPTIQMAIDSSAYFDTVIVENGVYHENLDFLGKPILVASRYLVTADTFDIENTVINGSSLQPVVVFQSGENGDSKIMGFTLTNGRSSPGLPGGGVCCINGSSPELFWNIISGNTSEQGGGVYCSASSPTIRENRILTNISTASGGGVECADSSRPYIYRNIIYGNNGGAGGGGIHLTNSEPTIAENTIDLNTASYGGGIGGTGQLPIIIDNTIISNSSTFGGGLFIQTSNALIRGNLIRDNEATGNGGGIYTVDSNPLILHNRFEINSAVSGGGVFLSSANTAELRHNDFYGNFANYGGAIYLFSSSPAAFKNITFNSNAALRKGGAIFCSISSPVISNISMWFNEADSGGGIYCAYNSHPVVTNSIFWDNAGPVGPSFAYDFTSSVAVNYSDVEGGWTGNGNIDADPIYRDPLGLDLRLSAIACSQAVNSPCIDTGHPDSLDFALDCLTGLGEARADMGAYGGGGNSTGIGDRPPAPLPAIITLLQNYPNPFNARTTLRYALTAQSDIKIGLYNVMGQKVAALFEGTQRPGEYAVTWDASAYASGVYFAQAEASGQVRVIRLMLLK